MFNSKLRGSGSSTMSAERRRRNASVSTSGLQQQQQQQQQQQKKPNELVRSKERNLTPDEDFSHCLSNFSNHCHCSSCHCFCCCCCCTYFNSTCSCHGQTRELCSEDASSTTDQQCNRTDSSFRERSTQPDFSNDQLDSDEADGEHRHEHHHHHRRHSHRRSLRCRKRRGTTTATFAGMLAGAAGASTGAPGSAVAMATAASPGGARVGSLVPTCLAKGSMAAGRPPPENRIVINVGGVRFETYKSTLKNIPDTRLAWLTETTSTNNADYDPDTGEYFFDRHSGVFAMILNYYRTGRLHTPMDICGPMFEEELAYWGIDEKQMESCCWTTYRTHRDAQETLAELNGGELSDDNDDGEEDDTARKFGIEEAAAPELTWWQRHRPRAWAWLEGQGVGVPGKILATVSVFFILASIVIFMVETLPVVRIVRPESNISNCTGLTVSNCLRQTTPHAVIQVLDIVITFYFTLELLARIAFCPQKQEFFKSVLNWIDIVAVVTAFISYAVFYAVPPDSTVVALQILKVPRIFRIFKLTRHFSGLKILVHTMKASSKELMLLAIVFAIFVILCGTAVFICEQFVESHANDFTTIPIGFWWALVTMTTLGYGDVVPRTLPGYLVGGVCAISGVLVIALPVPIIVNNFALYYTHAQARLKLPKRKKRALVGAPDALKQTIGSVSEVGEDGGGLSGIGSGFVGCGGGGSSACCESDDTEDSSAEGTAVSRDEQLRPNSSAAETPPGITVEFMDSAEPSAERKRLPHSCLSVPDPSGQIDSQDSPSSSGGNSIGVLRNPRLQRRSSLRPNGGASGSGAASEELKSKQESTPDSDSFLTPRVSLMPEPLRPRDRRRRSLTPGVAANSAGTA